MKVTYHVYKDYQLAAKGESDEEIAALHKKEQRQLAKLRYSLVSMCYHPGRKKLFLGTTHRDGDLLVEFDGRPIGLFHLSRTQHYLETVLGVPRVDLVLRDAVKPALRDKILREAVYAA